MPWSRWSRLRRFLSVSLGFAVGYVSRLEEQWLQACRRTMARRQLSRFFSIALFGLMSVCMLGSKGCTCADALSAFGASKDEIDDFGAVFGFDPYTFGGNLAKTPIVHPRIMGTDGSQTGVASFLGNLTVISQPPQTYFVMARQKNCSLALITATSSLNGTATATGSTPNYEATLHQLAGLKTAADVFPNGCPEPNLGITSRAGVWLGATKQGIGVFATAQPYGGNNAVFTMTTTMPFSTASFNTLSSLTAATAIAAADLNGDGNGDMVVVNDYNAASSYVSVVLGNADGTFQTPANYPTAGNMSVAAVVDDVNGDGKADVVVASDDQHISVLLGVGDGTLHGAQSFSAAVTGTSLTSLITADVNHDGKRDLICSNGLVLLGNGDGTFTAVSTPAFTGLQNITSGVPLGMATGDLNNDGKADLVVGTGSVVYTFKGNGDGTFVAGLSYPSIDNSGYVTVTDLDGDGNADIYLGLANGGLYSGDDSSFSAAYVLMGNGDGTFQGAATVKAAYNGSNLGDVNGDGVMDLVSADTGVYGPGATFYVQLGNGKGGFTTASTFTSPSASFTLNSVYGVAPFTFTNANTVAPSAYAVGDVNGDGKADVVYAVNGLTGTYQGSSLPTTYAYPVLFVALSNGDGTFKTPVPYVFPAIAPASGFDDFVKVSYMQIADFNKDGKPDLVMSVDDQQGGTGTVPYVRGMAVLKGNGDGTFATTPSLTATYSSSTAPTTALLPQVVSTADVNGDGKPDMVVMLPSFSIATGAVTQLETFIGNGDGTFKTPTTVSLTGNVYGIPALVDVNKDGKLDLVTLGETTTSSQAELEIALGNGDGTFGIATVLNLPVETRYRAADWRSRILMAMGMWISRCWTSAITAACSMERGMGRSARCRFRPMWFRRIC